MNEDWTSGLSDNKVIQIVFDERLSLHVFSHTCSTKTSMSASSTTPHWTLSRCDTHCRPYSFSSCASHKALQGSPAPGFTCEEEEEPSERKTGRLFHLQTFSKRLIMQQNMSLLCSAVWLFLVYFARVCPSADKHLKCGHDRHNQFHHTQKTYGARKFCDPSFSNHTAGAVTQVRQLSVGFSAADATFPLTLEIVLTHFVLYSVSLHSKINPRLHGLPAYFHFYTSSVFVSPRVSMSHPDLQTHTRGGKKVFSQWRGCN